MALIDLIILGLVLAFVISRFMKHDLPSDPRAPKDRVFDWKEFAQSMTPRGDAEQGGKAVKARAAKIVDMKGLSGVELLKTVDEGFDEAQFKQGVEQAYKYFYKSWNAKDVAGLDKLCGPELMGQLEASLKDYAKRGATPEVLVNRVDGVEIVSARLKAKTAIVEAKISALQSEGEVMAGKTVANQAQPRPVSVVWVLARATTSDDPNWELQKIVHEGAKA
ncbi:MAG: TIM44-like domain-containing protein [Alphaproteobacteria bacterium]